MQTQNIVLGKSKEKEARLKKSMFAGFRPIFCFSRIIGLMPFSIVCNSDGELQACRVKVVDCVWFLLSICVYLLLAIFNLLYLNVRHQYKIALVTLFVGNSILTILNFISCVICYIINMCNRRKFLDILKMFENFDAEVSQEIS